MLFLVWVDRVYHGLLSRLPLGSETHRRWAAGTLVVLLAELKRKLVCYKRHGMPLDNLHPSLLSPSPPQPPTNTAHHGRSGFRPQQVGHLRCRQRVLGLLQRRGRWPLRFVECPDPFAGCSTCCFGKAEFKLPNRHRCSVRGSKLHLFQEQQLHVSKTITIDKRVRWLTHTVFDLLSSAGAVAQLYDISCLYHSSPTLFRTIQEPLYEAWVNLTSEVTVQHIAAVIPALISPEVIQCDHYFIPNAAGTGISPVWDFRTNKKFQGKENAIFVGVGAGSVVPPVDPANNINWLRVGKVAGDIADEVYRIDTIGGQPPTSVSLPFPFAESVD